MNVGQGYYIVNTIMKDRLNVPDLGKEEFNDLLLASNDSFFKKLWLQKKLEAKEANIKFEEYLSNDPDFYPLKTTSNINLSSGAGSLPADFYHFIDIHYGLRTAVTVKSHIEFVSYRELFEEAYNVFGMLSYHPKCCIDSGAIYVLPQDITAIGLIYIANPATPIYAETYNATTGLNEYTSGSSTQWDWGERNHMDIILEILSMLDIASSKEEIKKYLAK